MEAKGVDWSTLVLLALIDWFVRQTTEPQDMRGAGCYCTDAAVVGNLEALVASRNKREMALASPQSGS